MSALDTQVGGSHYKDMTIQPMEYSMANQLDACQHTIIKYVSRFRQKGGVADLEKAKHVIDMLIEFEGREQEKQRPSVFDRTSDAPAQEPDDANRCSTNEKLTNKTLYNSDSIDVQLEKALKELFGSSIEIQRIDVRT